MVRVVLHERPPCGRERGALVRQAERTAERRPRLDPPGEQRLAATVRTLHLHAGRPHAGQQVRELPAEELARVYRRRRRQLRERVVAENIVKDRPLDPLAQPLGEPRRDGARVRIGQHVVEPVHQHDGIAVRLTEPDRRASTRH